MVPESLMDRNRSGWPLVISQYVIKKAFENDPCHKLTRLTQKKKNSVSTVFRIVKNMGGKSLRRSSKSLLSAGMVEKRLERSTRLLKTWKITGVNSSFFLMRKMFAVYPVFNKQNDRVATFGNNASGQCRVPTTKHLAPIMMLGLIASNGEKIPHVWF